MTTGHDGSVRDVPLLFITHEAYLDHIAGERHPERPARLAAVLAGARGADVIDGLIPVSPRAATRLELERIHDPAYLDRIEATVAAGGGYLDPDTAASPGSWTAVTLGAGAGLTAIETLDRGDGGASAAFCAVRPPGHHATPDQAMGFCLISNVAVAAAHLVERGERVAIVDYDAHHGNGTQAAFYADPRVLYVSLHQWPLYPGTGWYDETGDGAGRGTTLNVPLPPGATGDVYLRAFDELIGPAITGFGATWLIISAGFDAHRFDPITDLGLSSHDYALLTRRLTALVPAGRQLIMLEGGYDLDALTMSTAAVLGSLLDQPCQAEEPTSGGAGQRRLDEVIAAWAEA